METYSNEQRLIIVKTHYKNGESFAKTVRQLCQVLGRNNATVRRLITKFESKFTLMDQKIIVCRRPCRSLGNNFFENAAGNALTLLMVCGIAKC